MFANTVESGYSSFSGSARYSLNCRIGRKVLPLLSPGRFGNWKDVSGVSIPRKRIENEPSASTLR
jgi:hypothetical protein